MGGISKEPKCPFCREYMLKWAIEEHIEKCYRVKSFKLLKKIVEILEKR